MFTDYTTTKDRLSKKRKVSKPKQKITKEVWYNGKVYLHIPFVPFKVRVK